MQHVSRLIRNSRSYQRRFFSSTNLFDIHPEVQTALNEKRPIVACETAILTHGLPRQSLFTMAKLKSVSIESN